mmetsp:Transcript_59552/g.69023  ORF Transcript_59552/g.69023 Transcript_59552/m.69023 type:complete len:99 (-) Transcript_59552:29-325(-)
MVHISYYGHQSSNLEDKRKDSVRNREGSLARKNNKRVGHYYNKRNNELGDNPHNCLSLDLHTFLKDKSKHMFLLIQPDGIQGHRLYTGVLQVESKSHN